MPNDRQEQISEILNPDAVARVRGQMLPDTEYDDIAALFKNFGDATRVRILQYLQSGELCVSDMASLLGITKSAVSHQMQSLKASKLVRARRDGQIIYYSLDDEHVGLILDLALTHLRE